MLHLLAAVHVEHPVPHREQVLASVKKYVLAHVLQAVLQHITVGTNTKGDKAK